MTRTSKQYGLTTSEDIRIFLEFWPQFQNEFIETWQSAPEVLKEYLYNNYLVSSWCHLYELTVKEHNQSFLSNLPHQDQITKIFERLSDSKNKISAIPLAVNQVEVFYNSIDPPTKQDKINLQPYLADILGRTLSVFFSLRCVLYHGCFLNELIARARTGKGNDKALFDAIRIDQTVIGCKTAIERISKAVLLQDQEFLKKLKAAINGKATKREQQNFQKMRLVFEILYEVKSDSLNDDQLYELFVKTLKLYSWNSSEGGNAKALRKFADTYMKKQANT